MLGGFLVVLSYVIYFGWVERDMTDFRVDYKAGERIVRGETLYRVVDGHLQYKYAPISALVYAALALLPLATAEVIWHYLQLVGLFAAFWISYKCLPSVEKGKWFVIGFGFLILAKFTGREIQLGQVNILIILILTLMLAALNARQETAAGVLWGVSLFFKPYALAFLPYFILKKWFKPIAAGAAVVAIGLFIPAFYFGFHGNLLVLQEWVGTLSQSTPGLLAVADNASLYAFLWKLFAGNNKLLFDMAFIFLFAAIGGAFLGMMAVGKKRALEKPETLELGFLFICIPLFSPLGWYYNYLYSIPAVVLLLNYVKKFPPAWKYALVANFIVIGGTLREIMGKTLFRFYNHNSLMAVNYLLVLVFLFYLRLRETSKTQF